MTINYDPRAIEAKRQRAAELETPRVVRRGLHPTDFAVIVAAVVIVAALAAAFI